MEVSSATQNVLKNSHDVYLHRHKNTTEDYQLTHVLYCSICPQIHATSTSSLMFTPWAEQTVRGGGVWNEEEGCRFGLKMEKKKERSFFLSICLLSVLLSPYTPPPELYISNTRAWLPFNVLISHKQKTDHAAVTLTQVWSAPLVIYRCWEKNTSARVHAMSPFVHWGGTWLTAELKCWVGIVLTTRCDGNDFWVITVFVFVWVMWPYWRDVCLFFYRSGFRKIPTPVQNNSRDWYCHYILIYILPSHKRADIKYMQKHLHIHTLCAQQALTRLWEMTGYRCW